MTINIVSGKGGTGKTLLCAAMADILGESGVKTLVIDMDFAVRGLTALLYYYRGENYNIISNKDKLAVYDFFENEFILPEFELGIEDYRTFKVLPAVRRIDWRIDHKIENSEQVYLTKQIHLLLSRIILDYDYIFIDSRAGYDELNSVIHNACDLTICVQEEDEISYITARNLTRQFEGESNKPVLTLINKARSINDIHQLKTKTLNFGGKLGFLGTIPFDIDVMNSFGEANFWEKLKKTLYYAGVVDVLNIISTKYNLEKKYKIERIRPIPSLSLEKRLSYLGLTERTLLLFGLFLGLGGLLISFTGINFLKRVLEYEPERVIAVLFSLLGFALTIFVLFKRKK